MNIISLRMKENDEELFDAFGFRIVVKFRDELLRRFKGNISTNN